MNRKVFLLNLLSFGGFSIVPQKWRKSSGGILLLKSYIAGFKYYDGPALLKTMKIGEPLDLVREPNNKYDACAVAVKFRGRKIGFVPASKNEIMSKLMDNKLVDIVAEITDMQFSGKPSQQVSFGVYSIPKT